LTLEAGTFAYWTAWRHVAPAGPGYRCYWTAARRTSAFPEYGYPHVDSPARRMSERPVAAFYSGET
jgi:hypothetical protein